MPLPENEVAKEDKVITAGDDMIADGLQFQIDILSNTQSVMEEMRDSLDSLVSMFGDFLEKQNFLLDAQAEKSTAKDMSGATVADDADLFKGLKGGWFSTILLAGLAAYALGWDKYIRLTLLPRITIAFTKMFMAPITWLDKTFFSAKPPKEMKVAKMKRGVQVKTWGTRISGFWDKITAPFRWLGNWIKNSKMVQNLKGMKFPKLSFGLRMLKWVFMKALFPLFMVLDLITGFVEGFQKTGPEDTRSRAERVIAGVKSGLLKVVENFVVWPINAAKDGLAWLMGKMGFTKVQEWLKSFDLIELFKKGFDPEMWKEFFKNFTLENNIAIIKMMFTDFINGIKNWLKGLANKFTPEGYKSWGEWFTAKKEEWSKKWESFYEKLVKTFEDFKALPGKLIDKAKSFIDEKIRLLGKKIQDMKLLGIDFTKTLVAKMAEVVKKIKDKLLGWFHTLTFGIFKAEDPDEEKAKQELKNAEETAKLKKKIVEEQARIKSSEDFEAGGKSRLKAGQGEYWGYGDEGKGREKSRKKIAEMQAKIDALAPKEEEKIETKEKELKIDPTDKSTVFGQNLDKQSAATQNHASLLMSPTNNTDNSQDNSTVINAPRQMFTAQTEARSSADKIMYQGIMGTSYS